MSLEVRVEGVWSGERKSTDQEIKVSERRKSGLF